MPRAAFSTLRRMRTLLSIAAVLMAAALPAVAIASRAPSHDERAQLRQAVKTSNLVGRSFHRGHFKLAKPRISDSGRWAKAGIRTETYSDPFNAPKALFKHNARGWKLVKLGTSGVGCKKPRLSQSLRKELGLRCG
jgi:hypothetical protein